MKINIVDAVMGSGKTSAAINYFKKHPDKKYMYVTPYLTEVERIQENCPECNFKEPFRNDDTKLDNLKKLLKNGCNISTTHALFHMFDDEIIELCYIQDYILIMDEVTDVVEPYNISDSDINLLLTNFVTVGENNILEWRDDQSDYSGKFGEVKRLCSNGSLALYGNKIMMWMFPIKIFEAFDNSYILTYMFEGQVQKYYYDYFGMEYEYLYVAGDNIGNYHFTREEQVVNVKCDYDKLITIIDNIKLNKIGDTGGALSKTWYIKHGKDVALTTLKNNVTNFFIHITKSKADNCLWTTFKEYEGKLKGKGYGSGFLSCNARATNRHKERHNVAYLVNRYFNPVLKQFFSLNNIDVDEDRYALSEMLQFIWRSAIRQGEPITLYIPSRRMRELLQRWIAEQIKG